jgi:protocatechuate 3,4-dioxygenase beta subunit
MRALWRTLLILLLAMPACAKELTQWIGLAAFDPLHLDGAYAGRQACPMCLHGYDAGLLVFVPADTDVAVAKAIATRIGETALPRGDARYRVFMVATGAAPSPALRTALRRDAPNWYVAQLTGDALAETEQAYFMPLTGSVQGLSFAQRRLIRRFDAARLQDAAVVAKAADDAMALLRVATTGDADGRGLLWMAPTRLPETLRIGRDTRATLCFTNDAGRPLVQALVMARPAQGQQATAGHAAKTLDPGCVDYSGPADAVDLIVFAADGQHFEHRLAAGVSGRVQISAPRERIVGLPCEGCEIVFAGRPAVIPAQARIAPAGSAGTPMRIEGRVLDAAGRPVAGIVVYGYHTDAAGHYPGRGRSSDPGIAEHGALRGWVRSDAQGHWRFDTIRPGGYPGRVDPEHVHLHVIEPGRCTYYIDEITFSDDPRNHAPDAATIAAARGGSGYVTPKRAADGSWQIAHDIVLGRNVRGYADCAAADA